jgi:hypothetical protein
VLKHPRGWVGGLDIICVLGLVGGAAPGGLNRGRVGADPHHGLGPKPSPLMVPRLARGRVAPVDVLEHHQHRLARGEPLNPRQLCV